MLSVFQAILPNCIAICTIKFWIDLNNKYFILKLLTFKISTLMIYLWLLNLKYKYKSKNILYVDDTTFF